MTEGLKRYQQTGHSHFLTFSCYHRRPYFGLTSLRDLFLASLERERRVYRFLVYAYVVMPEHVHLLVSEPEGEMLATALQALKISVSRLAAATGHSSPFWQKRYFDRNVRDHREFLQVLDYIHGNPVARGLCGHPIEWRWSSFRHYDTAEMGPVEIESEWTAMRRNGREPRVMIPTS